MTLTEEEAFRLNPNAKFDIQLSQALIHERRLGSIFHTGTIELKTETHQWEKTGNICIEYKRDDKPSGIAVTEAEYWVHELRRDDETLVYLMFPIERLKELARAAIKVGRWRGKAGDGGRQTVAIILLSDIFR